MHNSNESGLSRKLAQENNEKIQHLEGLHQWLEYISTSPLHPAYGSINNTQFYEISYALAIKNLTIDDLFAAHPNRSIQLTPIYQILDITLETEPYYHMRKVFFTAQDYYQKTHSLPKKVAQGLQRIIFEQIQAYRDQQSVKSLLKPGFLTPDGYQRIPEYRPSETADQPMDCLDRIKNYLTTRF